MQLIMPLNGFIQTHLRTLELVGVGMRICSFSLVSWLGPGSPFLLVWIVNTVDAVVLSWCSVLKRDPPYILLNVFWIGVGIVGMYRSAGYAT